MSWALERQAGSALAKAALQDTHAVLGLETSTESVRTYTLHLFWLIVSLHAGKIARISRVFKAS